ncbi:MAG: Bug family tripartite tricarboxylate transporter substrate binding protein [bacterium]
MDRRLVWIGCALLPATLPGAAIAQAYPVKPVRIMVGYTPGGGVDTTARIAAQSMTEAWGTQVLVENRPGAAGNIATEFTARAAPDGYTLVLCNIGSHGVTPARFAAKLTYDPIADFSFPARFGGVPNVLMVHPSVPMKNLRDFIAYARKHPGKLSFGSSGVGASPHMSIELMKSIAGIDILHVPYKGASAALADVLSGNLEASVGNFAGAPLSAIRTGRLRALGVTSGTRSAQMPEIPTFAEQGIEGFDVTGWYGLCTQAKVPVEIITRINTDVNRMLGTGQALVQRLVDQGIDIAPATPAEFAAMVRQEIAKWTKVVRETKLGGD